MDQAPSAPATGCSVATGERHTVAEVTSGDTLTMTDGTVVRLIGAKAPSVPLGYRGDSPWPLVDETKRMLAELASGAEVELVYGGTRADRHGNALAQVFAVGEIGAFGCKESLSGAASPASTPSRTTTLASPSYSPARMRPAPIISACGVSRPIACSRLTT